jgi:predicted outer membrane protein
MASIKRAALVAGLVALALVPGAAAQAVAAPSAQDTSFLQAAHQGNMAEIAKGNLTQQKNASQQVKDLGSRFVSDHTRLDQSLTQRASGLKVTLPGSPTTEQQAALTRMQGVDGQEFDRMFVETNLTWHEQMMQLIETEMSQGSDPEAKRVAQDAAPIVQAHHEALQALAQSMGLPSASGSASPGASGGAGTPSPSESSESAEPENSPEPGTSEEPEPGPS